MIEVFSKVRRRSSVRALPHVVAFVANVRFVVSFAEAVDARTFLPNCVTSLASSVKFDLRCCFSECISMITVERLDTQAHGDNR